MTLNGFDKILERTASMTGAAEIIREEDSTVIYFKGKYMTFTLKSGEKLFFILKNPSTGMKGETEVLFKGVFLDNRYYIEKI